MMRFIGPEFDPGLSTRVSPRHDVSVGHNPTSRQLIRLTADPLWCVQPGAYLAKGTPMSFASSLAVPASSVLSNARALLRGGSLRSMANAVGVVVGAGMLAAGYS